MDFFPVTLLRYRIAPAHHLNGIFKTFLPGPVLAAPQKFIQVRSDIRLGGPMHTLELVLCAAPQVLNRICVYSSLRRNEVERMIHGGMLQTSCNRDLPVSSPQDSSPCGSGWGWIKTSRGRVGMGLKSCADVYAG